MASPLPRHGARVDLHGIGSDRLGQVDDVANLVRFLLGEEAGWITGTTISVDGGHHLRRGPNLETTARALFGDEAVDGQVGPDLP